MLLQVEVECCTLHVIGIYSNCTGRSNRSQLNVDAGKVSAFNKDVMKESLVRIKMKTYFKWIADLQYLEYDVCDDFTLLSEIVQDLILDENFKV